LRSHITLRFVTVTVLSTKHQTPVVKKSLNPQYLPKDATFDFPLYLSVAEKLGAVELVVWDKDMLTKEYLGEASLLLTDWFPSRNGLGFNDAENMASPIPLVCAPGA
jgi:phosphatidylserine decarboxylase